MLVHTYIVKQVNGSKEVGKHRNNCKHNKVGMVFTFLLEHMFGAGVGKAAVPST